MNKNKHLVLVGGGHAHMLTLANLHRFVEKGYLVTVIAPSVYHYYSGMGPGMLSRIYRPDEIRFATRHVVEKQGGRFVLGKAERVDAEQKTVSLESGEVIPYDVISFNCGSYVPRSIVSGDGKDVFTVKPIEKLLDAQQRILEIAAEKKPIIGIIGGGPAAVEIAGNIWRLARDHARYMPKLIVFAGRRALSDFPDKLRQKVFMSFGKRGIELLENGYVKTAETGRVTLESGEAFFVDMVIMALGVKPSPVFTASGLPTGPDGGLMVNRCMQSTAHGEIFGGGDCIYFKDRPLDKVGVYAVRQNPVLYHNLMASLGGAALEPFVPGGEYLLIFNLGDGTGIFRKKSFQFSGKPAFWLKDYIDRKFIRRFQALE